MTDPDNPTTNEWKDAEMIVKKKLVSWFLRGANNELYGDLKIELEITMQKDLTTPQQMLLKPLHC